MFSPSLITIIIHREPIENCHYFIFMIPRQLSYNAEFMIGIISYYLQMASPLQIKIEEQSLFVLRSPPSTQRLQVGSITGHSIFQLLQFYNNKGSEMKTSEYSKLKKQKGTQRKLLSSLSANLICNQQQGSQQLLQKAQVAISNIYLQGQLKCYEWRLKTEFPVVKIHDYRIAKKDHFQTVISLRYQNYPLRISQLQQIPLFKILYLLKESIIAFQRLYDRYGPFSPTSRMIALTHTHKCRVWFNQRFASNQFTAVAMEQKQFLQSICRLFVPISNKLKNTVLFFRELCQFTSFCQALAFIQNYARQNKISIPNSCRVTQKEYSIIQSKPSLFNPSLTMTRSPKFLNSSALRSSLKPQSKLNLGPMLSHPVIRQELLSTQDLNMKTSGDTAADVYCSKTMTVPYEEEKQQFDQSIIFDQTKKSIAKPDCLTFSKGNTAKLTFTRQLSQLTHFSPDTKYSISLDKSVLATNFQSHRQIQSQEEGENEEVFKQSVKSIFNKNKWEKTLEGLFGQDNLKKSSQHGQQQRKQSQFSTKRLLLLESVSKDLHESFINQDYANHF